MNEKITFIQPTIKDSVLQEAAQKGCDEFINVFVSAINSSVNNELSIENMQKLNVNQITLLAYRILQEEVMNGGFVQLIHNGYGEFIFKNPFSKVIKSWGLDELATLINRAHRYFTKNGSEIEKECSDDEFMLLFEKFSEYDDCDDFFIEHEEEWTNKIAYYIDENVNEFAVIEK